MKRRTGAFVLMVVWTVFGQEIHLKTRTIRSVYPAGANTAASPPGAERPVGHQPGSHQIVQFDHSPSLEDLDALLVDGNPVVSALPDNSVVVAASSGQVPVKAGVQWVGNLETADKLSPELRATAAGDDPITAIVEFHPDIPLDAQDAVAAAEGSTFLRPAVLAAKHAIVTAPFETLTALAAHDEVAYIFPADPGLATDSGFNPCIGMLSLSGPIAQYANIVHGWDLDADGAAHLGYVFGSITPKVPAATVQAEIVKALNEWSRHTNVIFQPGNSASSSRTILVKFISGAHGDAYPFDGPGGILAHTFYPVPVNPESIAGDMHLDADENWHAGGDPDIYSVALHEAGHAIGLGHSDKPGDVMYPYYRSHISLSANDIGAAQALYGIPGAVANPITSATPATTQSPPAPMRLTLDSVPASTQASQASITGILAGGTAPFSIQWQTDHGYSGHAALTNPANTNPKGTASWTASGISLVNGANLVSITAFDGARQTTTQTANISLVSSVAGTGAPISLSIVSPASVVVTVNAATVSVAGTASGGAGVTRVTWQTTGGATGTASGTAHWVAPGIPLLTGTNTIVVRAYDAGGANAWSALVVVRR